LQDRDHDRNHRMRVHRASLGWRSMIDGNQVRIGARCSQLSRRQTETVRSRLATAWPDRVFSLILIETRGDRTLDTPLPEIGGTGLFTLEIEEALRAGTIDLAVHSLKDLPTDPIPGIVIGAIPERVDVRDALISRSGAPFLDLPKGATIGTSSHRRAAQLRRARPDLRPQSIRGNIENRLRKTHDPAGPYDAAVLAVAGLERLDLLAKAAEILPLDLMLPAPGQGALAVQCRDEPASRALLAAIDDSTAHLATSAERAFLAGLGGGCSAPIAGFGELNANRLQLRGRIVALDASEQVDVSLERTVEDESMAIAAGAELARMALERGAATLLHVSVT
jgi:hydroxymethylbilane synthase